MADANPLDYELMFSYCIQKLSKDFCKRTKSIELGIP